MSLREERCLHPVFVWGSLVDGAPLAWALSGSVARPARIRARLWHLSSGAVAVEVDPGAGWVHGEIHAPLLPERMRLIASVLGADNLGLQRQVVPALCEGRTVRAVTWSGKASDLRRAGATPLRMGDWSRYHPSPSMAAPDKRGYPSGPASPPGRRWTPRGGSTP